MTKVELSNSHGRLAVYVPLPVAHAEPAPAKVTLKARDLGGESGSIATCGAGMAPDGNKIAGVCLDTFVSAWDAATGAELAAWKGYTDRSTTRYVCGMCDHF
ncbi:MAG TPA: hypothetical protein VD866_14845 [Urbifossiella sp.]|nr:hypothetical protein [Urbifossiella sp.]